MAPHFIDVVSDSTGETAERVVKAALLQFPQSGVELRLHARVRTKEKAARVLKKIAEDNSLLVFSVVSPELSSFIHETVAELRIEAIDIIGALIGCLEGFLDRQPIRRPGPTMPLSDDYFRRIEAVEFTVKSDAGRDPRAFGEADLILVGVSRTSKTPVATLLAQRGLKVANLTLVLEKQLPAELQAAPRDRIVGLTIDAELLCEMRQERLAELGMPAETRYALGEHVKQELDFAERLFEHHGWPVVDMTHRSVEETASIILEMISR